MFYLTRPAMLDPAHFRQPEAFVPERWLQPRTAGNGPHEQKAYLAFGAGPRVCPGRYLAAVEMRLVISMMARRFKIELDADPESIEEVSAFTMVPNRMPITLAMRS